MQSAQKRRIASTGRGESMTTFIAAQRMPSARALSIASSASPKVEPQAMIADVDLALVAEPLPGREVGVRDRRRELGVPLLGHAGVHLGRVLGPAGLVVLEPGDGVDAALLARDRARADPVVGQREALVGRCAGGRRAP